MFSVNALSLLFSKDQQQISVSKQHTNIGILLDHIGPINLINKKQTSF